MTSITCSELDALFRGIWRQYIPPRYKRRVKNSGGPPSGGGGQTNLVGRQQKSGLHNKPQATRF